MLAAGHEDVARLDIPMNDACRMRRVEGIGDCDEQRQRGFKLQRLVSHALAQVVALQELHGDETRPSCSPIS
jgi:hypothetical protein